MVCRLPKIKLSNSKFGWAIAVSCVGSKYHYFALNAKKSMCGAISSIDINFITEENKYRKRDCKACLNVLKTNLNSFMIDFIRY